MVDPPGNHVTESWRDRGAVENDNIIDGMVCRLGQDWIEGKEDTETLTPQIRKEEAEDSFVRVMLKGDEVDEEKEASVPTKAIFEQDLDMDSQDHVMAASRASSIDQESEVEATINEGNLSNPLFESAQAAATRHNPNLADGKSIIMSSNSIVASDYVSYIDEVGDDICSLSPTGSPDRSNVRQRVASADGPTAKDASGEVIVTRSQVEDVESLTEEHGLTSARMKRVSFIELEGESSSPSIQRFSLTDAGATSFDLSVVSSVLEKSLLSTNGDFHENINEKIEAWDADIKSTVTNLNLVHAFPRGLAFSIARKCRTFFPLRLWLINNNGATSQGKELLESVDQQVQLSETMEISSIFCLLNSLSRGGEFSISSLTGELPISLLSASAVSALTSPSSLLSGSKQVHGDVRNEMAQRIMESARQKRNTEIPWGAILRDAGRQIESADDQLEHHKQVVVVCIVTDEFILTDEVASNLLLMQRLPVQFVIRLIGTVGRESMITDLKDTLTSIGLRSIRVLGDLSSHQLLVSRRNPWLNYGAPLHRYLEMGIQSRTISLLPQRQLDRHELREFFVVLFGRHVMLEAPDLEFEWPAFLRYIKFVNESANKHWNGLTKTTEPWLNIRKLDSIYGMAESRSFVGAAEGIQAPARYSRTQVEL